MKENIILFKIIVQKYNQKQNWRTCRHDITGRCFVSKSELTPEAVTCKHSLTSFTPVKHTRKMPYCLVLRKSSGLVL